MRRYHTITFLFLLTLSAVAQLPKVASTNATGPNGSMIGRNFPTNWLYVPVDTNGYLLVSGLGGGGGGGGVSNFSAGNLPPLFTTNTATSTTTPFLTFTLTNAGANTIFGNFTGSSAAPAFTAIPTWNQSTTGNAATASVATASDHTPTLCGAGNAPTGVDANWNAVGCAPLGGPGSGGPTLQTNGTNNLSQTVLNFVTSSSIAFTNPSTSIENASIVSPGSNTVLGFNGSNVYTGFTLGAGLAFSGSSIVATTGNLTGTLTTGTIPVASGAHALSDSLLTDNGTTLNYSGSGGISGSGTTPAAWGLSAGTGNVPSLAPNSAGFVAPNSGGTSYRYKLAPTAVVGWLHSAAPLVGDNVLESALTSGGPDGTLAAGFGNFAQYTSGTVLIGTKMVNAGQFTNIMVLNTSPGTCTGPTINVEDLTTTTFGTGVVGPNTGAINGSARQNGNPALSYAAGDDVAILVQTSGSGGCTYNVAAEYTSQ